MPPITGTALNLDCCSISTTDSGHDNSRSKDAAAFRQDLLAIARTTLSSKVLAADKDYFAELAVSAVLRLKVRLLHLVGAPITTDLAVFGGTCAGIHRFGAHSNH